MRVSVAQMKPGADKAGNIAQTTRLIDRPTEAESLGSDPAAKQVASRQDRFTYGHSLVCDPRSQVISTAPDSAAWTTARLDPPRPDRVRRGMPAMERRRDDVFSRKGVRLP